MRVNARLDDASAERLQELVAATGESVSEVLRESIAHYHVHVKGPKKRPGLVHFGKWIGKGASGLGDLAEGHKRHLSESLAKKHGLDPATRRK